MKKRPQPSPTPFEVAQLAVRLLPYTSDEANEVTEENKVVRVPTAFYHRAKEAVEMVHALYGYACLHEQEELERKGNAYWPLDSKEEMDAHHQETGEQIAMYEKFQGIAKGRPEIEAKEFMGLMLTKGRKPSIQNFIACWDAFESAKGVKLPFTSATACRVGMQFPRWYKENYTKVSDKLRKGTAASGGKKKHSNANKAHGEAPVSAKVGAKIDKAYNRLPKSRQR